MHLQPGRLQWRLGHHQDRHLFLWSNSLYDFTRARATVYSRRKAKGVTCIKLYTPMRSQYRAKINLKIGANLPSRLHRSARPAYHYNTVKGGIGIAVSRRTVGLAIIQVQADIGNCVVPFLPTGIRRFPDQRCHLLTPGQAKDFPWLSTTSLVS